MGAEVTVLSQSLRKQEDGLRLGADHYYATSDPGPSRSWPARFDLIVNTVSANLPMDDYLACCARTAPWSTSARRPSRCRSHAFSLIGGRRSWPAR